MNNMQIVCNAALAEGIYTEEQIGEFMSRFGRLPLFTFSVWKASGWIVKKGEHAKLVVRLWQKKTRKKVAEPIMEDAIDGENDHSGEYYLKTCYLFSPEQVEKIKDREPVMA